MQRISIEEFKDQLKKASVETRFEPMEEVEDEGRRLVLGWVENHITTSGLSVTRRWQYSHPQFKPSGIDVSDDAETRWEIHRMDYAVHDEDGMVLAEEDILGILPRFCPACEEVDHSDLDDDDVEILDEHKHEGPYELFRLELDDVPNLQFTGVLIEEVSEKDEDYEDNLNRWCALQLYQTSGGRYVCCREDITRWQGEEDHRIGQVCSTHEEIVDFFGHGSLAKALYDLADIPHDRRID